ncbi:hypothetical protein PRUPE_6G176100 [Prunus persica]|uniref:Uncharacterized protein n=1 Tax=Prunus persica TaxID=3760 RepID=A0A251NRZ7_PRUPE|nr:hypothetical protein PRUPE_6G176100 [Prunus persica]
MPRAESISMVILLTPLSKAILSPKARPQSSASRIWPIPKFTANPLIQFPEQSRRTPPAPIFPEAVLRDPSTFSLNTPVSGKSHVKEICTFSPAILSPHEAFCTFQFYWAQMYLECMYAYWLDKMWGPLGK